MPRPDRVSRFLVYPWILIGFQILMLADMVFRLYSAAASGDVAPNPALDGMIREPGWRSIAAGAAYLLRLNLVGLAVCAMAIFSGKWSRDLFYKIPLLIAALICMIVATWLQVSLALR